MFAKWFRRKKENETTPGKLEPTVRSGLPEIIYLEEGKTPCFRVVFGKKIQIEKYINLN